MNKLNKATSLLALFCTLLLAFSMSFASCSDDDDKKEEIVDPEVEKIYGLEKELTDLRDTSIYGGKKGMYPSSSKSILNNAIVELGKSVLLIKFADPKPTQAEIDQYHADAAKAVADFKATIRTEDLPVPGELYVNGMENGYIDFGSSADYSTFGVQGSQQFTIDVWFKFTDINGFGAVITTFYEGGGERKGWMINHFDNQKLRMSYSMSSYHDMLEPGTNVPMRDYGNKWVHFVAVYNDEGVDGEMDNGHPIVSKIYRDGELKDKTTKRADSHYYISNDLPIKMTAFLALKDNGDYDRRIAGYIKDFHIWKTAKSESEVKKLMNKEIVVDGTENDLVCGWDFNTIAQDDSDVKDLTGKYSAKLVGAYEWHELE